MFCIKSVAFLYSVPISSSLGTIYSASTFPMPPSCQIKLGSKAWALTGSQSLLKVDESPRREEMAK